MKKYLFIGIGGFIGASARYFMSSLRIVGYQGRIPVNTFMINILGSFLITFIVSGFFKTNKNWNLKLGITVGLLGAYTTFSTFCKEIVELILKGLYFEGILYAAASFLFGLAAAGAGMAVGSLLKTGKKTNAGNNK